MIRSAITISLVPEARGGPFVFWVGLEGGCRKAAELGFDGVEVFARSPEELDRKQLGQLLESCKLRLAAIGTGAGWVVHKLRLTDASPDLRRRAREFVGGIIDCAAEFGAPAIIGSMQGRWGEGVSREQALAWLGEALEELGARAEAHQVPLLLEPLNRYETNLLTSVRESLDLLKQLRTRNVKLLCDLFHMNIEEADIGAALKQAGSSLGHVHFADSNRRAAGLGHTDMRLIATALAQIGYEGYLSAEILPWPDSDTAARQTIQSFRTLFGRT